MDTALQSSLSVKKHLTVNAVLSYNKNSNYYQPKEDMGQ